MRKIIFAIVILSLVSCATTRHTADTYADAAVISEQRTEIDRLRRDLTDMADNQRQVSERIDSITEGLADGIARCATLEGIFAEIDIFVRELITENTKLRELQRGDKPESAGNE